MTVVAFIKARRDGAAKIADEARAKGGVSILTAVHFEAKLPSYDAMERLTDNPAKMKQRIRRLESATMAALAAHTSMSQFQKYTGKLEAFGEVVHFLENPEAEYE